MLRNENLSSIQKILKSSHCTYYEFWGVKNALYIFNTQRGKVLLMITFHFIAVHLNAINYHGTGA